MKFTAFGRTATVRTVMLAGVAAVAIPASVSAQDTDLEEVQQQTDSDGDNIPDAADALKAMFSSIAVPRQVAN